MDIKTINGNTLAYVGDAIYSLQVREHFVRLGNQKSNTLQKLTVAYVSAVAQAKYLKCMIDENILNDTELDIVRRGRNAKSNSIAKNTDVITYRNATGLEALWGYLYLDKQSERLEELINYIFSKGE